MLTTSFHAVLSLVLTAQATPPSGYTITDVSGPLAATHFSTTGLSDTGFVCGWLYESSGRSRGFRWSPAAPAASQFSLLDPPAEWGDYQARDVNDKGVVVGLFGTTIGGFSMSRGYVWSGGAVQELLTSQGRSGIPEAINDAGWIAGGASQVGGPRRAMLWSPDLVPTVLQDLEVATDVNDGGQVVGYVYEGGASPIARAYFLDAGATDAIPLGTLDPRNRGDVFPTAINNRGQVVGWSEVGSHSHAFLWTQADGMTELADLYPSEVGVGEAFDINDDGWIVGWTPGPMGATDTLWAPDGTPYELAPLIPEIHGGSRWTKYSWPVRINSVGQIAGGAVSGTSTRHVLLTPTTLRMSALTPGVAGVQNQLDVNGATPGKLTFLFGDLDDGLDQGFTRVPGCGSLGLALATPRFVSSARADAAGNSVHGWLVPPALAGLAVRLQAFQLGGCALSNVVRVAF